MKKPGSKQVFATRVSGQPGLVEKLLDVIGNIPEPREVRSDDPRQRSRAIARGSAAKAASAAGALALPPGPLGWLTIAPELYAVWKIQAQMVADIAGAHGKRDLLTREQMLYCLFSHTAAKAFRELVIRMGERYVVRRAPLSTLYAIANKVSVRIAQRSASRLITRWIPAVGALGVAGYVYVDTGRVADTAMDLFAADVRIEGELEVEGISALADAEQRAGRRTRANGASGNGAGSPGTATQASAKRAGTKRAASKKAVKTTAAKKPATRKDASRKQAATKATTARKSAPRTPRRQPAKSRAAPPRED